MSELNREDIRLSLERIVDRQTTEVQTLDTEGHGLLIQETDRNESAEVGTGLVVANNAEQNEENDIALDRKKEEETQEAIRKMANVNFVVSTIIASVTYAAVVQVPGGYDNNGKANLSKNKDFLRFLSLNSFAFVCSLLSMLIHFCVGHVRVGRIYGSLYAVFCLTVTEVSLIYLGGAFFCAISGVWTEGLTGLLIWDNKRPIFSFKHPHFDAFGTVLVIPTVFFAIVSFIFNKKYLVPTLA